METEGLRGNIARKIKFLKLNNLAGKKPTQI